MKFKKINQGQSPESNRTMATVGMWFGIVNVILAAVGLIVFLILLGFGVFAASSLNSITY